MLASVPFTGELTNKGYRKRLSLLKMKLLDVEYEEGRVGVAFMRHITFLTCIAQNKNICKIFLLLA